MLFTDGVRRLDECLRLTSEQGRCVEEIAADRQGWDDFYDALSALEAGIGTGDSWAVEARRAVQEALQATRPAGAAHDVEE